MAGKDILPILNKKAVDTREVRAANRDLTKRNRDLGQEVPKTTTTGEMITIIITAITTGHPLEEIERAAILVPGKIEMLVEKEDPTTTTESTLLATLTETMVTDRRTITRVKIITRTETTAEEGIDLMKTAVVLAVEIEDTHQAEARVVAIKPKIIAVIMKVASEIIKIDTLPAMT